MKSKKIICVVLMLVLCISMLTACSGTEENTPDNTASISDSKISIVCTIFPEYDWVREIIGDEADNFDLTLLMDKGVDMHNFQPTAADMAKVSSCDLFIYVGGESDTWVEDALAEATNNNLTSINLLTCLGDAVKEEEVVEGMQSEEDALEEEQASEEEPEYDEHVWLSLKNSINAVNSICEALCKLDEAHSEEYKKNAENYTTELSLLDQKYEKTVSASSNKTVVFGDRFPFRYMMDDYGIAYYAAFVGCSAETEASFETITFLANKLDELKLDYILVIENSDTRIAETIIENTGNKNMKICVLDSMQSETAQDVADGTTYLGVMEKNLEVLSTVLN